MISRITLDNVVPDVFRYQPDSRPSHTSHVWESCIELVKTESYLVFAASGTGKSSLCSYLYGSRCDYSGTIAFDGEDIRSFSRDRWSELRRTSLAYLPQDMGLFAELTAMENIMLKNRLSDYFTETDIRRMLDRLGIAHKADTPAGRLSIGQQQRVALVRALSQPFDFIMLDEPVSHLDEANNAIAAAMVAEQAALRHAGVIITSVGNHLLFDSSKIFRL